MSAGEYLPTKREGGFVLNNKCNLPYPADIPKVIVDPLSVSKAVYTAINAVFRFLYGPI